MSGDSKSPDTSADWAIDLGPEAGDGGELDGEVCLRPILWE